MMMSFLWKNGLIIIDAALLYFKYSIYMHLVRSVYEM